MSPTVLGAAVLLSCSLAFGAAQASCRGRCGGEYNRGSDCQCDFSCLSYGECCRDYESRCTSKKSCKGRCGEMFKRGRLCNCDSECVKFKQCCSDYKNHCDADEPPLNDAADAFSEGNDADDHLVPLDAPTTDPQDDFSPDLETDPGYGGVEDPIPDTISGYGPDVMDQLDPIQPTQEAEFSTEAFTAFYQTTEYSDQMTSSDPGTTFPLPTTLEPEPVTLEPELVTLEPELETLQPEPVTLEPELETLEPEPVTLEPELETLEPEPELATLEPEMGTLEPEMGTLEPEPVTLEPELATLEPEMGTLERELGTLEPEPVTMEPELATLEPEMGTLEPELATLEPEMGTLEPELQMDPTVASSDAPEATASNPPDPSETTDVTQDTVTPAATAKPTKPSSKPQKTPPSAKPSVGVAGSKPGGDSQQFQADDNDINLCSGRPVSGATTLKNGTVVVFRGHYFWMLDTNRVPGPARDITQVWGVPSPIDTVFTRCNCQGKTYIFKGPKYWRFENDVLDGGYPKVIQTGFDGLRGHITAALSVPQYQRRRESVYFFKRGGNVQKYSYQHGTSPTCGRKVQYAVYTVRNRIVRQAVSLLGPTINIQTSWRGFPSAVTAAVSIPSRREPDGYKYYVFSRKKSYNVRLDGERPVVATPPANAPPLGNGVFKCPQKV